MFQRVLVPLDGSHRAEQALPVAAQIARASGGTVLLLQAVRQPTDLIPIPAAEPGAIRKIIEADLEESRNYLESITNLSSMTGIRTETKVILGHPAATILSVVDDQNIDLVVMCSHGYTGMKRWVLGSIAEKVAHRSPVPVLMLREDDPGLASRHLTTRGPLRVLVPLDGSTHAITAIAPAAQLIAALSAPAQGSLHLTQVVILPPLEETSYSERETILQEAGQYLSSVAEQIRAGHLAPPVTDLKLSVTWSVTIDNDIAEGIVRVAEIGEAGKNAQTFNGCDIIAMATHGLGGQAQWTMGSVTERVLLATRRPLLIVRPAGMLDKGTPT